MESEALKKLVIDALEDIKAINITEIDVRDRTSICDVMIIATGSTNRQVKSLADSVVAKVKEAGQQLIGVEGQQVGEWVLVDLGDVIVHVMQPQTRELYSLEKLWEMVPSDANSQKS